jgi:DNA-binding response OmpR family regulator
MGDQDQQTKLPQEKPEAIPEPTSNAPTVLFIEDDPLLLKMYETKFKSEGLRVLAAQDGEEGLKLASSERVDLIILDLMMPKLSGLDMLERLKSQAHGKSHVVIVLTNLTKEEEIKRAMDLGVKEYLVKADLTPNEVAAKVKAYLGK